MQSYYRLGVALQGLERHEDAMVAFAEGLAIDSKSAPLLNGLTQTMLSSPLKGKAQYSTSLPPVLYVYGNGPCMLLCVIDLV